VIALGGGVVGDLAGFAAASYQRGVNFIQVPTTLLAQVDSSVGGKTGVNHSLGKNMIGAFYQPRCVLIDTATLASLSERDYLAGLAEVLKYGVIYDRKLFAWFETNHAALVAREPSVLRHVIVESCRIKAEVVAEDEREQGLRAILNYGHTFGHALENLTGYGTLRHGEAVAIGMVQAADFAVRLGLFERLEAQRIKRLIAAVGLPVAPPAALAAEDILAAMALDKKTIDGRLRFVLPSAIGSVAVHDISTDAQMRALHDTLGSGPLLCEEVEA
jgi:3-dehydroquinate synthase